MKYLLLVLMACSLAAADVPQPAPVQQTIGVSSIITIDRPLELSGKILGFIHAENQEVVIHFDVTEIVAVHKFPKDQVAQSIIVFNAPLAAGRQDTFILIPENIMTFDKVLEFVDSARKVHLRTR